MTAVTRRDKVIRIGEPDWPGALAGATRQAEGQVEEIAHGIQEAEKLIRVWKVRPLPVEGDFAMPPPLSKAFDRWIAKLDARGA